MCDPGRKLQPMGKLRSLFARIWLWIVKLRTGLASLASWLLVLKLPGLLQEHAPSVWSWQERLMSERETLLIWLSGAFVLYFFWTDLKPTIRQWLEKRKRLPIAVEIAGLQFL